MPEVINTFEGGMNSDHNKLFQPKNTYPQADNIRLTTFENSDNVTLNNVLGTQLLGTIPTAPSVWKAIGGTTATVTYNITINGITLIGTGIATITNLAAAINASTSPFYPNYTAYVSTDGTYMLITTATGNITSASITLSAGTVTVFQYIAQQANLIPIGSTKIRDEIIIITTNETAQTPLTTGGIGQIWRLTYDKVSLTPTFTLVYHNFMNITTYHPIPPTAIQGRYENSTTKRIWWTDNFNQLRSYNTGDPTNNFAIDPELLNIQPPVDGSIPILDSIGVGNLTAGMYQVAYRLKNGNAVTYWSELSDLVQICASTVAESIATGGANSEDYIGEVQGTQCSKSINWIIKNLDTDFERIEIAVLHFDTLNGAPAITITHDEEVPQTGDFKFTYSGNEQIAKLTTSEFLNQTFSFTHCKTVTTKDNELIVANIRNEKIDFTYDARAYRFPISSSTLTLNDAQSNPTTYLNANTQWTTFAETLDAINPDHDINRYRFNSNRLGGDGPNISYEFGTQSVKIDSAIDLVATGDSAFAHTNPSYVYGSFNLGVTDQDYPQNGINDGLKYAYKSVLLRGYQRHEIYRFAIVFYDKLNRPLFARWIGDIKMPTYADVNNNPDTVATSAGIADFRSSFIYSGEAYAQSLYVKFNVNVPPTIRTLVGGFRICRVERTQEDKTILGTGLLTNTQSDGGTNLYMPDHHTSTSLTVAPDLNVTNEGVAVNQAPTQLFTFDSSDFLLTGFPGFASTDKIIVAEKVLKTSQPTIDVTPGSETEPYRMAKFYDVSARYNILSGTNAYTITEAVTVGYAQSYTIQSTPPLNTYTYNNFTRTDSSPTESAGVGSNTLLIGLGSSLSHNTTYGVSASSYLKLYCLYYRQLTTQYGGNSYSARSRNNYIPCGSFQPLTDANPLTTSFTQNVFGGDITIDCYDNQKIIKNAFNLSNRKVYTGPGVSKNSFTYFWATESSHNMNLRHGVHINKDLGDNVGAQGYGYGASVTETYDYNTVYSQQPNFITYIPKPLAFRAVEEHDTRIWVSEQKENGEEHDSWGQFLPAKYYDADSAYGPINALITFRDQVYFFQNDGFGIVPISDRALIQANAINTSELQLGRTDEAIQRPEYISKTIGTKHQWSVTASKDALYFFDIKDTTAYRSTGQETRAIEGLSRYFGDNLTGLIKTTDNQVYNDPTTLRNGILVVADNVASSIYFTFFDAHLTQSGTYSQFSKTVSFSEEVGKWASFMSFAPTIYIDAKDDLLSPRPAVQQQLHIHNRGNYNTFYGALAPSTVSIIVNDSPKDTKTFNNFEWVTDVIDKTGTNPINILGETWSSIRVYDDYQNTSTVNLTNNTNIRRAERSWRYAIPRNIITPNVTNPDIFDANNFLSTRLHKDRMRDKYIVADFTYNNPSNRKLVCPFILTRYLISPR